MAKRRKGKKAPKVAKGLNPTLKKEPRASVDPEVQDRPVWRLSRCAAGGQWCPLGIDGPAAAELAIKLSELEKLSWVKIKSEPRRKSHFISPSEIVADARREFQARKLDEYQDLLFSLRVNGKKRLWGILDGNVFYILWWDPEHQIYPTEPKGT